MEPDSSDLITITFDGDGFSPLRLEVEVGQQVVFTNESDTLLLARVEHSPDAPDLPGVRFEGCRRVRRFLGIHLRAPRFLAVPQPSRPRAQRADRRERRAYRTARAPSAYDARPRLRRPVRTCLSPSIWSSMESDNAMTRFLRDYGPAETVKALLEGSKRTNARLPSARSRYRPRGV